MRKQSTFEKASVTLFIICFIFSQVNLYLAGFFIVKHLSVVQYHWNLLYQNVDVEDWMFRIIHWCVYEPINQHWTKFLSWRHSLNYSSF
jgi:hypothetical protein